MSDSLKSTGKSRQLAGLMSLDDEATRFNAGELVAIMRHQLAAPLEYDLRTIAPGGEQTVTNMTAAISTGPRPRTFGDLIVHPLPPLDLISLMKEFARGVRDSGSLPSEVGTMLYYAAISLALCRHSARITSLDDRALHKGIEWAHAQSWIDPSLKALFAEGLSKLKM